MQSKAFSQVPTSVYVLTPTQSIVSSPASGNTFLQLISLCCYGPKHAAEPIHPSLSVGCGVWSVGKLASMAVGTAAASAANRNRQGRDIFGILLYYALRCSEARTIWADATLLLWWLGGLIFLDSYGEGDGTIYGWGRNGSVCDCHVGNLQASKDDSVIWCRWMDGFDRFL